MSLSLFNRETNERLVIMLHVAICFCSFFNGSDLKVNQGFVSKWIYFFEMYKKYTLAFLILLSFVHMLYQTRELCPNYKLTLLYFRCYSEPNTLVKLTQNMPALGKKSMKED